MLRKLHADPTNHLKIILGFFLVIFTVIIIIHKADATDVGWQSSANPTLAKTLDLVPNTMPSSVNFDCLDVTVRIYKGSSAEPDCLVNVPYGQVGGKGVIFKGTSESIPVVPRWPYYGLQPVPGSSKLMSFVSAPLIGSYIVFYDSIIDKMSDSPRQVNGVWQYSLTGDPDHILTDKSGKLLPVNTKSMAFSPNGQWMIADLPWAGFVRINMSTYEMLPFAPSLQNGLDYSSRVAYLAISNDGQTVVVKPNDYPQFKVYDLSRCNAVNNLPIVAGTDVCVARDYYAYFETQLPGLNNIFQPRIVNNAQITFTAVYDYSPSRYKVAKFMMTAPGANPTGMSYLGMGDSFASGEGVYEYRTGTDTVNNTCHLSGRNYAYLLSVSNYPDGNSVACSGAITDDIINTSGTYKGQVEDNLIKDVRSDVMISQFKSNFTPGYISQTEFIDQYRPEVVTLSIGGNDIGFADILKSCVSPTALPESCFPNYEDRLELAGRINGIFDKLVTTYQTVSKPGKRVYVIGYPQITYPGGNCALNVNLDRHELQLAADLIDYLNLVVEKAADRAGVRYIDVSNAFVGHRLCETISSDVAVNGFTTGKDAGIGPLKFIGNESYHPNALGHRLYEQAIRTKTNDLKQSMPTADSTVSVPDIPSSLNDQSAPKSNRVINTVISNQSIAPELVTRSENVNIVFDASLSLLKALTKYRIVMHSDPVEIGTAITNAKGGLSAAVQIPADTPPGFHTLHIYGPNMLGQPIDITRTIFVAVANDDADGDTIPNTDDSCTLVKASGSDVDMDGVDDACDGTVTAAPSTTIRNSNSVMLTNNVITLTKR